MAKIHLLDNDTINKIAAGEVIESPKSIVKELVENSIDAEADEIIVEIKNGGKKLIRITDNGKGIDRSEIEDAFKRHCTSKITTSDDLNSLFTLGFRGEALASIAAVSHVEVISRTKSDSYGVKMVIEGGITISREDIGCPVGTTITVTELFYNVPARKKFLKSDISESGNINEIVVSLALSKENISFKYINNNNIAFKTPKTNNFINTISSLFNKDLYESLLPVSHESNTVKIKGYTTNLNYYRGNRKNQFIFVNGRFIKHKRISYFIEAAYHTMLPKGKYPACFLKIEIEPELVDVNVHPAKTEIRFQNEELILNEVKKALYIALSSNSLVKEIKKETFKQETTSKNISDKNLIFNSKDIFDDRKEAVTNNFNNFNNNNYDNIKITDFSLKEERNDFTFDEIIENTIKEEQDYDLQDYNLIEKCIDEQEKNISETKDFISKESQEQFTFIEKKHIYDRKIPELSVIGILMDTYIICENTDKSEMYMIDQHAAHERINYEKFLEQFNNHEILKQELIIPETINLSYEDYYIVTNNKDIFENLGISIENFGINAILISNIPVIFSNTSIRDIFFTVLDSLKNINKSKINYEIDNIIKKACVKSVKSGDRLHLPEIKRLLEDLNNTENPYTCPHGRPVIIKMTKYEIERMFERIQI